MVTHPVKLPTVGIVVTNFNNERFIEKTIISALNQNYEHFHVVVVDDASSDRSQEILAQFRSTENLNLIFRDTNGGQSAAALDGCRALSDDTEFVLFLDGDDLLTPDAISKLVQAFLHSENDCGFVSGLCYQINEEDVMISGHINLVPGGSMPSTEPERTPPSKGEFPVWFDWGPTSTLLFRRKLAQIILECSWANKVRICTDALLVNLLHLSCGSAICKHYVAYYRRHSRNGHALAFFAGGAPGPDKTGQIVIPLIARTALEILKEEKFPARQLQALAVHFLSQKEYIEYFGRSVMKAQVGTRIWDRARRTGLARRGRFFPLTNRTCIGTRLPDLG